MGESELYFSGKSGTYPTAIEIRFEMKVGRCCGIANYDPEILMLAKAAGQNNPET